MLFAVTLVDNLLQDALIRQYTSTEGSAFLEVGCKQCFDRGPQLRAQLDILDLVHSKGSLEFNSDEAARLLGTIYIRPELEEERRDPMKSKIDTTRNFLQIIDRYKLAAPLQKMLTELRGNH